MIGKTGQFSETPMGDRASRWLLWLLAVFHPLAPSLLSFIFLLPLFFLDALRSQTSDL